MKILIVLGYWKKSIINIVNIYLENCFWQLFEVMENVID